MTSKCPYCLEDLVLVEGVYPYHDYPKPTRRVCSSAQKTPEEALEEFRAWTVVLSKELFDLDTEALKAAPGITVQDVSFDVIDED
jgi:hypothetical protein